MDYISTPQKITFGELVKNQHSWSPLQYKKIQIKNKNTVAIEDLLSGSSLINGKEVGSNSYVPFPTPFKFVRTKAIQPNNFQPDLSIEGSFEYINPISFESNKGNASERIIQKGDLLFVTGGNVGEVAISNDLQNSIASSHITKIPVKEHRLYIFAFLKNQFGKEQANFGPVGAIAGLDTFSEKTLLRIQIPFPTQKNKGEVIKYIESLVKITIAKEQKIRHNNDRINEIIEQELNTNQKDSVFSYVPATFKEIQNLKRLDTGMYGEEYKRIKFLIKNYSLGESSLDELDYMVSRGQNLQVSNIGKSIYSDLPKPNFYKLILSKDFSDWMTAFRSSYLGNPKELKKIKKGDIVFSCRGDLGRVLIFLDDEENVITNIDNVQIVNNSAKLENKIFVGAFLNYLRMTGFLSKISITGSGADSFTQYQFDLIKIPNFSEATQKEITKIYTSPYKYPETTLEELLTDDAGWNENVGIYELDQSLKAVKAQIDYVIDMITRDESVSIDLSFLKI